MSKTKQPIWPYLIIFAMIAVVAITAALEDSRQDQEIEELKERIEIKCPSIK